MTVGFLNENYNELKDWAFSVTDNALMFFALMDWGEKIIREIEFLNK